MSEAERRPGGGSQFISLWKLFRQIGKAERAYEDEAARYLTAAIESDPVGMNLIRHRDELGIVVPLEMDARLHVLRHLGMFARHGTLFDVDDMPNDQAQPIFERYGFYASDLYPFLGRNDVAVCRCDDGTLTEGPLRDERDICSWVRAYDEQPWLSRGRAVKILISATHNSELWPPQYDDVFRKWDDALCDAVERCSIEVTNSSKKQMLSHADIRAWCAQHDYVWPLVAPKATPAKTSDCSSVSNAQVQCEHLSIRSRYGNEGGVTKREQQIRAIEAIADELQYPRQQIPDGGKTELRNLCKSQYPELFGGGNSPFDDAWKAAGKTNRLVMANRHKFAGR